ncbi:MAG: type I-E CRISPR-associated protein Cse2/CasB [Reinekea sp.]
MTAEQPDDMALYNSWRNLDSGASAQMRRVASPDELLDIPAFYRFIQPFGWYDNKYFLLRQVFCLSSGQSVITHTDKPISLGKALRLSDKINERRIMQLVRSDSPNDMVQLRRLIIHVEPTLNWPMLARQLHYWGKNNKRQLLEDFVLAQPDSAK